MSENHEHKNFNILDVCLSISIFFFFHPSFFSFNSKFKMGSLARVLRDAKHKAQNTTVINCIAIIKLSSS